MQLLFEYSKEVDRGDAVLSIELKDWDIDGDYACSFGLFGWCISSKVRFSGLELHGAGSILAVLRLNIRNENVAKLYKYVQKPYEVGFHGRISKFIVPQDRRIEIIGWGRDEAGKEVRLKIGNLIFSGFKVPSTLYKEVTSPLLVLGMGRSGTTMLMGLLKQHPQVFVPGSPPYEVRQATWLSQCAHVLSSPYSWQSMGPDSFEIRSPHSIGYNPYRNRDWDLSVNNANLSIWQENALPISAIDFCKRLTDEFVRVSCDSRMQCLYIAEKMSLSPLMFFVKNIYPNCKIILLVRDFRDVWLSARAFNRKRGVLSFERENFVNDLDWLKGLSSSAFNMMRFHQNFRSHVHLLRYEDILETPVNNIHYLFHAIGMNTSVESAREIVEKGMADKSFTQEHSTSSERNSARWRYEMTPEEIEIAAKHYETPLRYFGYKL